MNTPDRTSMRADTRAAHKQALVKAPLVLAL